MNCREYCPYKEICKKQYPNCQGEERLHHSDCPMAWRIEDIIMDANDIAEEQRKSMQELEIPFCEGFDGEDTDDLEG